MSEEMEVNQESEFIEGEDMAALLLSGFDEKGEPIEAEAEVEEPVEDSSTSEPVEAKDDSQDEVVEEEESVVEAAEEVKNDDETSDQVVLTKDGKHTIPFEVLETERQDKKDAFRRIGELEAQLAEKQELQASVDAAKAADEEAGGDEHINELLAELEEERPELVEGMKALIAQGNSEDKKTIVKLTEELNELKEAFEPVKETAVKTEMRNHFTEILDKHEDLEAIMATEEEGVLFDFLEKQPSFVRAEYQRVINNGSPAEVIELLDTFKDATGYGAVEEEAEPEPSVSKSDGKEAAKKAVAQAKDKKSTPSSLSDIPAGSTVVVDEAEAMLNMGSMKLMDKFANKSPEEIEKILSKVI